MFHIDQDKFEKVVAIFNEETDPSCDEETIRTEIVSDWNNAEDHQEWLDNATPQEIADWLASFYS